MSKQNKSYRIRADEILRSSGWIIVACVSLLLNAAFISTWMYLIKYNPLPIYEVAVNHACESTNYSHILSDIKSSSQNELKFRAASLCFVDYQTGKSLDLNYLRPNADSPVILPAYQE
jgi:hypothetical protein